MPHLAIQVGHGTTVTIHDAEMLAPELCMDDLATGVIGWGSTPERILLPSDFVERCENRYM